jgi:Uma2 family endonuclease
MATTAKRLTYDDLEAIPQEREGDRHEIINGELVVTPSPVPRHQIVFHNLILRLGIHIETEDLGMLLPAATDIRLTSGDVLIPDLSFILKHRLDIIGSKAIEGPPDLVVEILSPGTRRRDLTTKRALYAGFGVSEYWLVDPEARTVTVLALVGDHYEPIPIGKENLIQSRVLPGLTLDLQAVFKGL